MSAPRNHPGCPTCRCMEPLSDSVVQAMTMPADQWMNPEAAQLYHHDDVVRELVGTLIAARQRLSYDVDLFHDQGLWDREDACLAAMSSIDAALNKIEGGRV